MHDSLCGQVSIRNRTKLQQGSCCFRESQAAPDLHRGRVESSCRGKETAPCAEGTAGWMGGQTADPDKQVAVEWTQQGRDEAKLKLQRELGVLSSSVPDTHFVCVCAHVCVYMCVQQRVHIEIQGQHERTNPLLPPRKPQ